MTLADITVPADMPSAQFRPSSYDAALIYLRAGIASTFPLVPGSKNPMVSGFHGAKGDPPASWDRRQHDAWLTDGKHTSTTNLGWRLTTHIAFDIDEGVKNFLDAQQLLGVLPAAPSSTARGEDAHRRTYVYSVPADRVRPGINPRRKLYELLGVPNDQLGVDVIHRYTQLVAVWPSVHHSGQVYRWYTSSGEVMPEGSVPVPSDFPALPQAWLDALLPVHDPRTAATLTVGMPAVSSPFAPPARSFTRAEAESRFIQPALDKLAAAKVGGINTALNDARMTLSHFVNPDGTDLGFGTAYELNERLRDAIGKTAYDAGRTRSWRFEDNQRALLTGPAGNDWRATLSEDVFAPVATPVKDETPKEAPKANSTTSTVPTLAPATPDSHARHYPMLPEAFWKARPWLETIREQAKSRMCCPDAAFGAYFTMQSSQVPVGIMVATKVESPTQPGFFSREIGSPQTLGVLSALAAAPGIGKGNAVNVAKGLMTEKIKAIGPKTGEGMLEAFYDIREIPHPTDPTQRPEMKRVRATGNIFAFLDEGEAFLKAKGDKTNITGAVMRALWSGSDYSTDPADKTKRRSIEGGTYNFAFLVSLQPEIAHELLSDTSTGMAQRFLWFSGQDGTKMRRDSMWAEREPFENIITHPVHPRFRPTAEEMLSAPFIIGGDAHSEYVAPAPRYMTVTEAIWTECQGVIADIHEAGITDDVEVLDLSHRNTQMLKIAGVFAYLDGADTITDEVWALAKMVHETSCAVRDTITDLNKTAKLRERAAQNREYARAQKEIANFGDERKAVANRILDLIKDAAEPLTRSKIISTGFQGTKRDFAAETLDDLVEAGHLITKPGKRKDSVLYVLTNA